MAQANSSAQFRCYKSLSDFSDVQTIFANGTAGIRRINAQAFQIITAQGIQQCEVPANAPVVTGGSSSTGPFYLSLKSNGRVHHLAYGENSSVVDPQEAAKNNSQLASCRALTGAGLSKEWKALLDEKMTKSRLECEQPSDRGMSRSQSCLLDFVAAVQPCTTVKEVRNEAREIQRAARANHRTREANIPRSAPSTSPSVEQ